VWRDVPSILDRGLRWVLPPKQENFDVFVKITRFGICFMHVFTNFLRITGGIHPPPATPLFVIRHSKHVYIIYIVSFM